MSKPHKIKTVRTLGNKYPTISQFEKLVNPEVSTKGIKSRIIMKPILPSYLKEFECHTNPFFRN